MPPRDSDALDPRVCLRCGISAPHANARACIADLRDRIVLEFRVRRKALVRAHFARPSQWRDPRSSQKGENVYPARVERRAAG